MLALNNPWLKTLLFQQHVRTDLNWRAVAMQINRSLYTWAGLCRHGSDLHSVHSFKPSRKKYFEQMSLIQQFSSEISWLSLVVEAYWSTIWTDLIRKIVCALVLDIYVSFISFKFVRKSDSHLSLQPDALNAQFSHMTLAQQQPSDGGASAPDNRHFPTVYHHHHHPSSMVLQGAPPPQQQQVASYMVAGPSGGHPGVLQGQPMALQTPAPNHAYPSSTPGPAAFPGSTLNQQLLQQHTYIQQPVQQVGTPTILKSRWLSVTVRECGDFVCRSQSWVTPAVEKQLYD